MASRKWYGLAKTSPSNTCKLLPGSRREKCGQKERVLMAALLNRQSRGSEVQPANPEAQMRSLNVEHLLSSSRNVSSRRAERQPAIELARVTDNSRRHPHLLALTFAVRIGGLKVDFRCRRRSIRCKKSRRRYAEIGRRKEKVAKGRQSGRGSGFESAKPPKPERGRRREGSTDETSRTTHARAPQSERAAQTARAGQRAGPAPAASQRAIMLSHESRETICCRRGTRVRKQQTLRQAPPCLAAWLGRCQEICLCLFNFNNISWRCMCYY